MPIRGTWAVVLVVLVFASCGSEEDGETRIAVKNSGTASIAAAVSDGDTELRFDSVAAGTTSTFQPALFGALSGLTVSVGNVTSTVALTEGASNVVDVGADGKVSSVFVAVSAGGSEGGGAW